MALEESTWSVHPRRGVREVERVHDFERHILPAEGECRLDHELARVSPIAAADAVSDRQPASLELL
jgi:hypothetical protein